MSCRGKPCDCQMTVGWGLVGAVFRTEACESQDMHFRIAKVVLRTGLPKANRYLLAMQPGLPHRNM